jgi:hypothetical protein
VSGCWLTLGLEYCLMMGFGINDAKISCANIIVLVSATTLNGKQVRICKKAALNEKMKLEF